MSKADTVAFEYAKENGTLGLDYNQIYDAVKHGYHQAEEDLIDKTLLFLKDRLYKNGYVGIIDLCDDYIKAMKDE